MVTKVLIIPYFGKFNDFFDVFLTSCSYQKNYTFLFFTDDRTPRNFPKNSKVIYMSFEEFVNIVQKKFDFQISLTTPYKLCDFKPAYGDIFYDYISCFDYWGFCDIDVIFGDLDAFYNDDLISNYDRISDAGHFSLFKNNKTMREAYKTLYSSNCYDFKAVFSSSYSFAFDEWGNNKGFNRILLNNGFRIFYKPIVFADIRIDKYGLRTTTEIYGTNDESKREKKKKHCLFLFDKGHLYQYYLIGNKMHHEEYSYIHLQKRPMKILLEDYKTFLVVPPNLICDVTKKIDNKYLSTIREKHFYFHYWKIKFNNFKRKMRRWKKR